MMVHTRFELKLEKGSWDAEFLLVGISPSCLKTCTVEMRHFKMSQFSGNVFRIHSVHSKLKSCLDQLQMNECISVLLFGLDGCLSNI